MASCGCVSHSAGYLLPPYWFWCCCLQYIPLLVDLFAQGQELSDNVYADCCYPPREVLIPVLLDPLAEVDVELQAEPQAAGKAPRPDGRLPKTEAAMLRFGQ